MAQIDLRNATLFIVSGSNFIEVKIGDGNLTYAETRDIKFVKSRGNLDTVREGEQMPMDVSFTFVWEFITGDGDTTIEDALKREGGAVGWLSTNQDPDAPYCVDLQILYTPPCTSAKREAITFSQFNYEKLSHSLKDGTVDCSGKCNAVKAIVTRSPQS